MRTSKYVFTGMRAGRWNTYHADNLVALRLALYRYIKKNKLIGITKIKNQSVQFFLYQRAK